MSVGGNRIVLREDWRRRAIKAVFKEQRKHSCSSEEAVKNLLYGAGNGLLAETGVGGLEKHLSQARVQQVAKRGDS